MQTEYFDFEFSAGSALDIGRVRKENEDRLIICPKLGFFAVSDGMGGLAQGGKTSEIIAEVLPEIVEEVARELGKKKAGPGQYGAALKQRVRLVSDNIFETVNTIGIRFGATLCCVWLIGDTAVYVNLGDSRGCLLPRYKRELRQITEDHDVAGELVKLGELTKDEVRGHPSASRLTQFVGMPSPAFPDVFLEPVTPGDRIILSSDGLHGMLSDPEITRILRSSRSANKACRSLASAANEAGGHDNISAVVLKVKRHK